MDKNVSDEVKKLNDIANNAIKTIYLEDQPNLLYMLQKEQYLTAVYGGLENWYIVDGFILDSKEKADLKFKTIPQYTFDSNLFKYLDDGYKIYYMDKYLNSDIITDIIEYYDEYDNKLRIKEYLDSVRDKKELIPFDNLQYNEDIDIINSLLKRDIFISVQFKINGQVVCEYDMDSEMPGEREKTIELVAFENNVNKEDVKVEEVPTVRTKEEEKDYDK